jgi:hypothetical protein
MKLPIDSGLGWNKFEAFFKILNTNWVLPELDGPEIIIPLGISNFNSFSDKEGYSILKKFI